MGVGHFVFADSVNILKRRRRMQAQEKQYASMDRLLSQVPDSLSESSLISPQQFFQGGERLVKGGSPSLAFAVLADALICLRKYSQCRGKREKRLFIETYDYLVAWDTRYIFSALNICDFFSLEYSVLVEYTQREYGHAYRQAKDRWWRIEDVSGN